MVKASDCGPEDRGFESHLPPHLNSDTFCIRVFYLLHILSGTAALRQFRFLITTKKSSYKVQCKTNDRGGHHFTVHSKARTAAPPKNKKQSKTMIKRIKKRVRTEVTPMRTRFILFCLSFDLLFSVRSYAYHCDLTFAKFFKTLDIALTDLRKLVKCTAA